MITEILFSSELTKRIYFSSMNKNIQLSNNKKIKLLTTLLQRQHWLNLEKQVIKEHNEQIEIQETHL